MGVSGRDDKRRIGGTRSLEPPPALGGKRGDLARCGGIVGQDPHPRRSVLLTHRADEPKHRPRAAQAARIDQYLGGRAAQLSNGFFGARSVSRTGTAPKPRSRRMPLTM